MLFLLKNIFFLNLILGYNPKFCCISLVLSYALFLVMLKHKWTGLILNMTEYITNMNL